MRIAVLHYHLGPGGVTSVIHGQASVLKKDCDFLVITGGQAPENFPASHARIDELGYDDPSRPPEDPRKTADAVEAAIRMQWRNGCDLIHVHNPLLDKNSRLLKILEILKNRGFPLFLQVHDFAEDGRPWSCYPPGEYPADCHYGVINSRDYAALKASGLSEAGLHLLPNMVEPFEAGGKIAIDAGPFILYPVRAIRRKNIGEALLLSFFFKTDRTLAITLPPNSPRDWSVYREWKNYALANGLKVLFEASALHDFRALVNSAESLLSTSISEGFGFAFLEPWTAGKALAGRRLPEICLDFEANGVRLDHLYDRLTVPIEWIDEDDFHEKWRECITRVIDRYGMDIAEPEIAAGYRKMTAHDEIDFAVLDEPFQRRVIDRLLDGPSAGDVLKKSNPFLAEMANPVLPEGRIAANRDAVLRAYSPESNRRRLLDIYRQVIAFPVRQRIDREVLHRRFLRPETFSLLKWCDHDV